ncbi:MAG: carbohydrate ABC transporter permease [Oscillospiraceae bacterium]|nr:carbohydrate ABC transporter permease [Oscillospiraceae bacterium]
MKKSTDSRGVTIALLLAGLVFITPVLLTLLLSLRFEGGFPTWRQYEELLITNYTFLRFFWNSMGYSLAITLLCVLISFPLGFLFAKVRFWGRDTLFLVYIIAMLLPFQATLLPNYIQLRDFDLLNTPMALILPAVFSPFAVFLFRQFIKSVPSELIDYTMLETSSAFLILRYAVFPQIRPAAAALSVIVFCESWNMIEPVLIFAAKNPDIHPLSVRLGDLPPPVFFSAASVYMYPILLLFLLFKEILAASMKRFRWDG